MLSRARCLIALALLVPLAIAVPSAAHHKRQPKPKQSSEGVFSVSCGPSHVNKDDPIVFPGQPGVAMEHAYAGATTTDAFSTYDSLSSSPTTCALGADTSAYWMATLRFPDGKLVPIRGWLFYYRGGSRTVSPPANLRVIAGVTQGTTDPQLVGWSCKGNGGPFARTFHGIDCGSGDYLKAHVIFPSYWSGSQDGVNDTAQMSYSPKPGYVQIPRLGVHITYGVRSCEGCYLSSDADYQMTEGGSLHADWINSWQQADLDKLVKCVLNKGRSAKKITDEQLAALSC